MSDRATPRPPWWIVDQSDEPREVVLPKPPPWRQFKVNDDDLVEYAIPEAPVERGYQIDEAQLAVVNTAITLRRPLLVTGEPGCGKTTLAHAIAWKLKLGAALLWSINTKSTLTDGLYRYDAIGRLHDAALAKEKKRKPLPLSHFLQLGPLGTAMLPTKRPRVLLIDEVDKSDVDLPNDLLDVLERGRFDIPELARAVAGDPSLGTSVRPFESEELVKTVGGRVQCREFPIVVMTSNAERDFPPAFLRRCVRLDLVKPDEVKLTRIVEARLAEGLGPEGVNEAVRKVIGLYVARRKDATMATDQLLNAVFIALQGVDVTGARASAVEKAVHDAVFRPLSR